MNKVKEFINNLRKNAGFQSFAASFISVLLGIVIGFIIMIIVSFASKDITISKCFKGFAILLKGPFSATSKANLLMNTGDTIFYAVPLIFTGLSVALAYKTGLFNIGAPGQYIMGTMGSLLVALSIETTGRFAGIMVWILAIIVGMILGALWGMIPGVLKAYFNINEVIVCIMTNWIAANIATWVFTGTENLHSTANTKGAFLKQVENNFTPKFGLDKLFVGSYIDGSIFFAIIVAIVIFVMLEKTTFGYELKACGFNKNASKYAGLNEKKNIIVSMAIAGALAGLGACFYYLCQGMEYKYTSQYTSLPAYGFNGIASAFLANCNPVGVIASSLLIRYLNKGGEYLVKVGYNRYVADIIIAIIIYVAGFSRIIREIINKKKKEIKKAEPVVIEKKDDIKEAKVNG